MSKLDRYINAATRDNTRRSYQSAIRHYETEWGGFLPATADGVARYLVDQAESLSINTLRQRLAALAQWHLDQGFPDPTKAPVVRKVFRGIQTLHPAQEKRAKPFQIEQLKQVVDWLDQSIEHAKCTNRHGDELRYSRNKSILLLGFWRGFRGDELTRLHVEHVDVIPNEGMICFFPQTKGDRQLKGSSFKAPALSQLCPVTAYTDWIELSGLTGGAVFRAINRWGHISHNRLHEDSLIPLLRSLFTEAGIDSPMRYSAHSLRRGFANWATANGWDLKMLMEYVGWKNIHSAMRYLESVDPFAQHRIESKLIPSVYEIESVPLTDLSSETTLAKLTVMFTLEGYTKQVRTLKRAHTQIEEFCLIPHQMRRLNKTNFHYELQVASVNAEQLDDIISYMLDEMHRIATNNQCFIEVSIHDPISGQYWN